MPEKNSGYNVLEAVKTSEKFPVIRFFQVEGNKVIELFSKDFYRGRLPNLPGTAQNERLAVAAFRPLLQVL